MAGSTMMLRVRMLLKQAGASAACIFSKESSPPLS
jgi:hypothetical protein